MAAIGTPDRLASFVGLAPVPHDSGRVSGNMRRPRRYHRGLLRAFCLSSMASLRSCPASHSYYWRKRNEGKGHKQALLTFARRRANVLWAMIRDGACYQARTSWALHGVGSLTQLSVRHSPPPVRFSGVAQLGFTGQLVEVDLTAALPD